MNVMSGLADKVSLFIEHFSVFTVSFVLALVTNWRLALAVLSLAPVLTGSILTAVLVSTVRHWQKACNSAHLNFPCIRIMFEITSEVANFDQRINWITALSEIPTRICARITEVEDQSRIACQKMCKSDNRCYV